ncbi:MAG TPA: MFS transporter [Syntrophales bacterium]|nr:MFS transporter [Syntrophales bacterium]
MERRWLILLVGAANFFFSQLYRSTNAVLAPYLVRDLLLNSESLGFLSAAFFYSFALTQIPILLTIDKVGPRRLMTGLGVVGVVGALTFALARNAQMAVAGRLLMGIGMSCAFIGSLKLLSVWFSPVTFATVSGLLTSIGTLGNIVSTSPLAAMAKMFGWRESFLILAGVHAVVIMLLWLIVRDRPAGMEPENPGSGKFSHMRHLVYSRDFWLISAVAFLRYGTFASLQALWAGPLLIMVWKMSPITAGNVILAMNVGTILGFPLWGFMSDKVFHTRKYLVAVGVFLLALTTWLLTLFDEGVSPFLPGIVFFVMGIFTTSGQLMYAQIKELFPPSMSGAAMTGINFFNMLGPAFFLQFLGILMSFFYPGTSLGAEAFRTAIYFCVCCQLLAGFLSLTTQEIRMGGSITRGK